MKQTRYRYKTVPLARKEAIKRKKREIEYAKARLTRAESDFRHACRTPLETEIEIQESVEPGEPGYDELSDVFEPDRFQGDFKRINIPKP
jgi:hypothetical protein